MVFAVDDRLLAVVVGRELEVAPQAENRAVPKDNRIKRRTAKSFEAICKLKTSHLHGILGAGRRYQDEVKLMMNWTSSRLGVIFRGKTG
jgi:hypothetical protein